MVSMREAEKNIHIMGGIHPYMVIIRITCVIVWANFYVSNLRYHFKHKKISPNWRFLAERRHIFRDLNGRFSLNFSDSYMAIRRIICASLGKCLCTKAEISLQIQENITNNLEINSYRLFPFNYGSFIIWKV